MMQNNDDDERTKTYCNKEDEGIAPSCNTNAVAGPSAAQISGKRVDRK